MMAIKNPVFGVGYEAYEENFERYATEILFEWGHRTAHNSWILALAELGLIGFLLYIAIYVTSIQSAIRIFETSPEFLTALAGYGAAMTFLSHTYLLYPYFLFGLVGAARRFEAT
jgi:O-antigen ligase